MERFLVVVKVAEPATTAADMAPVSRVDRKKEFTTEQSTCNYNRCFCIKMNV